MPSFKYLTRTSVEMVNPYDAPGSHRVDVYLRSGERCQVRWIGFRTCEWPLTASYRLGKKFVKMAAMSVSAKNGSMSDPWRILLPSEYVVCELMPYNATDAGVHVLINPKGWPIVLGNGPALNISTG